MSKLHKILPLAIAAVFAQGAGAQQPSKATSGAQQGAAAVPVGIANTRTLSGTVESIDTSKRRVELKGKDGSTATVVMGPQVKDFSNLKKGDEVTVKFTEAVAVALAKGDQRDLGEIRRRVEAEAVSQGPAGGKPSLSAMERTTMVANVFHIDRDAGLLSLRGTSGVPVVMRVQDKKALQGIEKNDQIVVSYIEAAALSVERGSSSASSGNKSSQGGSSKATAGTSGGSSGSTATSADSATRLPGVPGAGTSPGAPLVPDGANPKRSGSGSTGVVGTPPSATRAQGTPGNVPAMGEGGKSSSTAGGSESGAGSANQGAGSPAAATRASGSPGQSPTPGQQGSGK